MNDECVIQLRPDLYWKTFTNQGVGGLDCTCIGLDEHTRNALIQHKIYPNQMIDNPSECYNELMLIHRPMYSNVFLHTLCKAIRYNKIKTKYDYLGFHSAGGSSGSPLFGIEKRGNQRIGICGLHKAKNTCVNIGKIKEALLKQGNSTSS